MALRVGHRIACGPQPSTAASITRTTHPHGRTGDLGGNIDARPFVARSGFAHRRADGGVDIFFYETALTTKEFCGSASPGFLLAEAERLIWVQMPWPVPEGVEGSNFDTDEKNYWSNFFQVQRGHGSTSTRATGTVTARDVPRDAGTLHLESATENDGDLHGSVQGTMTFLICPK